VLRWWLAIRMDPLRSALGERFRSLPRSTGGWVARDAGTVGEFPCCRPRIREGVGSPYVFHTVRGHRLTKGTLA
jgi:hypothetical protein